MKKFRLSLLLGFIFSLSVLFIACNKVEFKIEFVVDGSLYETINTNGNETIKMPSDPTKDGFDFDGWYWDNNSWQRPFTANSLLNEPLSENMKVYAKWNADGALEGTQANFTDFIKIDGSTYSIIVPNATTTLNFSDIVEINNKSSWKLTTDIQGNNAIASKIATLAAGNNTYYILVTAENSNVKLYTINIRRKPLYLVTFHTLGGTEIDSQNIEEGFFATMPTQPIKTGYEFINWDFDFGNAITAATIITANWQANSYKINHYANNETADKTEVTAVFNTSVTLLGNIAFIKPYYDLIGWNTLPNGQGDNYNLNYVIDDYSTASNMDLYAIWQPTTYTINYYLENGTNGNNPETYNFESNTITLIDAEKTGYTFNGWYTENTFDNKIETIASGSHGNLKLFAKFTATPYNITYHLDNGANGNNPDTYTIETKTITLENATKTGYTFDGWYTENDLINKVTAITKGSFGHKDLYAKFTIIPYSITYHLDSGINGDNPNNYTIESNTIVFENAVKTGYDF